ncbi:hypothetical protein Tco_0943198, partial [Tanacetum coccineum]
WVSDEEPEAPLSLIYVPQPKYPEYLVSSDAEAPMVDQPLPGDASPTALLSGYIADFDPEEDLEEDPEEDPADYHADRGDDADDKSSDDDDDDDEEEEDEDEEHLALVDSSIVPTVDPVPSAEDDEEEEEEHPARVDFFVIPVDDPVPSAEDTEAFETDESAPTLVPSPRRRTARMSVRPQTPMPAAIEATHYIPSPPLHVPSPPLPLPSPSTHTSLTYDKAPLGYRSVGIRLRAASPPTHHPSEIPLLPLLLPSTTHRDDLPKADMPLQKRAHFTTPTGRFEVEESSSVVAARQAGQTLAYRVDYRFIDTMDASIWAAKSRVMNAIEVVNKRVTDLATTQR